MAPMAPEVASLDAAWLASRRWFRQKDRRVESVRVVDAAPLGESTSLSVLAARFDDGSQVRYFVPTTGAAASVREAADGDGAWRGVVSWLEGESTIPSRRGAFVAHRAAALDRLLPGGAGEAAGLSERRMGAQQSHTSVRLGDQLVLKLYRVVEPGINPEVALGSFLTDAGFRHVPALAGWIEYQPDDGPAATTAVLQQLVPARSDGWEWMLSRLRDLPRGPAEALAGVAQVGGITAEMHAALRSRPDASGFEAGPATRDALRDWHAGAVGQLEAAMAARKEEAADGLDELASRLRQTLDAIPMAEGAISSRIHGDYHLGQLLATATGFAVIDFEGEPARTIDERRRPSSPLRDVAGMLRSLDYAARTTERADGSDRSAWLADARSAFLAGYGDAAHAPLVRAFEVEKACYELRYETANRPEWAWLPLRALEQLAA
jgi:trehalose synthase-fused probable maltokinase